MIHGLESVHCKTAFIQTFGKRKFIFDLYTLVHKYTDILIKFYIREIYFDISYNFN